MQQRTFLLTITLVGNYVTDNLTEVEELVAAQMGGELDPTLDLFCGAVDIIEEQEEPL